MIPTKNYWRLDDFSLFSVSYVYVDHSSYLADPLFSQNNISVKFKEEMSRKDSPYSLIFCKVRKRDVRRFEETMLKLKDKMLLLGHRDYPKVCDEIEKMLEEEPAAEKTGA